MIIQNVPYIEDKKQIYASCQGPPTTMMALKFFLPKLRYSFEDLYRDIGYKKGNWFFETYIVKLFHKFKIPAVYVSTRKLEPCKSKACFSKISDLDFNKKQDIEEFNLDNYNLAIDYALKNNLFLHKKEITLDFIKKNLKKGKLVIATLNRNRLLGKEDYKGHFILIKGFDEKGFICNDAFLEENIKISFKTFKEVFYYIEWDDPENSKKRVRDLVVIG